MISFLSISNYPKIFMFIMLSKRCVIFEKIIMNDIRYLSKQFLLKQDSHLMTIDNVWNNNNCFVILTQFNNFFNGGWSKREKHNKSCILTQQALKHKSIKPIKIIILLILIVSISHFLSKVFRALSS